MNQARTDLRRAGLTDAELLADLGIGTFIETFGHLYRREDLDCFLDEAHSPAAYARLLAEPGVAIWIATTGNRAVGYLVAGPCKLPVAGREAGAGEIRRLYLWRDVQNQGIGTQLLHTGLAWLRETDRSPVYVGVWSQNIGAQRLYARHGFIRIGEYDFPVGSHLDREFILRQAPASGEARPADSCR